MTDNLNGASKVSIKDHRVSGDNFLYGYNSSRQAAVNLYKVNIGHYRDTRDKVNKALKPVMLHWFCNLIAYAATEHFVKDGDPSAPAYGDKLANDFADFLTVEVGIAPKGKDGKHAKNVLKYSSVVSGCLGLRNKEKVLFDPIPGTRMAALEGVPSLIAHLERADIKSFNDLVGAVQPGAEPMMALATRVANLNDEQRKAFERALRIAMPKAARKRAADDKASPKAKASLAAEASA